MSTGTLYIVATPIGNLGDITLRALETLKNADVIAAEDTRRTQKLLNHYGVATKTLSFHEYSDASRRKHILGLLAQGSDVALVSDAGTPLVSDPGFILVKECRALDIPVQSLPGPCAAITAVTLCGMDTSRFLFAGFLPSKAAARQKELARLRLTNTPLVLYESPSRVLKTLSDICAVLGDDTPVCVAREMTKLYEEVLCATAAEAVSHFSQKGNVKGEFVLIVGAVAKAEAGDGEIIDALRRSLQSGATKKEAVASVSASLSCPKNRVYQLMLSLGS